MAREERHFVVFDIETTGLSPEIGHEIIQLSAKALRYQDFKEHEVGKFSIILKPQNPDIADPKALEKVGDDLWQKALNEGTHPKVALKKFMEYLAELNYLGKYYTTPILVGYNIASFDVPFIKHWLLHYKLINKNNGKIEFPWAYYCKDVLQQMTDLFSKDDLPNRRLDTFAEMFNVQRATAHHDATEDVEITSEIFVRYMKMMRRIRQKLVIQNDE